MSIIDQMVGIDYGSKLAGTTVLAYFNKDKILFQASKKKQDADQMIIQWVASNQPNYVFLDAPMSLPGVYTQPKKYQDYFYREADKNMRAMSPMFLGGLTARAMRLRNELENEQVQFVEIYPSKLADILGLKDHNYKKKKEDIPGIRTMLITYLKEIGQTKNDQADFSQFKIGPTPDWHHIDALLALISGIRYLNDLHVQFGNSEEGFVIV
ncbi:MAG: hypothetical protein AAFO07_14220 [Bacteroidota bacterium]